MTDSIWNEERANALRSYCDQREFSLGQIADKMSARFGVLFTRNACIGKAHRMGIECNRSAPHCRPRLQVPKIKVKSERKPQLRKTGNNHFIKAKVENVEWKLRAVDIVCATPFHAVKGCRYPVGEGPFLFCNGKVKKGSTFSPPREEPSSYCPAHHALCCEAPRPRQNKYLVAA